MRIIAGEKKGFKLYTLTGEKTRPTTDFVKEAIFSIIYECEGLKVLDLYSGSGSLGFEALSRGAVSLDLVDLSNRAMKIIKKNIEKLEYYGQTKTFCQRVDTFLRNNEKSYDLIFIDPPYERNLVNKTIETIIEKDTLSKTGIMVVEHSSREKIDEQWLPMIEKQKKYGNTSVTLISLDQQEEKIDKDL